MQTELFKEGDQPLEKKSTTTPRKKVAKTSGKMTSAAKRIGGSYSARDIEVLEGLEPVRRR